MLRGINKQQIFEEPEDYEKFIQIIKDCKAISGFKIFAYCLMGNHIHLLIMPETEPIEQIFKRIGGRFVYWYNIKYQRTGHLFQDRYKSEPVENDEYLLTVIRYIHQNPIKAGICKKLEDYNYSSYLEYADKADVIDSKYIFEMISKEAFITFNKENNHDKCLDIEQKIIVRVTDEQAQKIIEKYSSCKNTTEFQNLDIKSRDKYIKVFKEKGLSIRQISRLTGTSFAIVRKL